MKKQSFFDGVMIRQAIWSAVLKLDPRKQICNPVMFCVYIGSCFTTLLVILNLFHLRDASLGFSAAIAIWLWFTVLFANFAEAMAEGRGKAQADTLRKARRDIQ